jgi:hypothetical protein
MVGAVMIADRQWPIANSEMGDDLDLDAGALRQRGHLDGRAGGEIGGEVLGIHLVHPGEVRQVRQEHRALDDIGEGQPLVIEDGLDVLQDAVGLRLDVPGDEVPVAGSMGICPAQNSRFSMRTAWL